MKTVILVGGSTLGHVIPGIAVGRRIRNKYPSVRLIYITIDKQKGHKKKIVMQSS